MTSGIAPFGTLCLEKYSSLLLSDTPAIHCFARGLHITYDYLDAGRLFVLISDCFIDSRLQITLY